MAGWVLPCWQKGERFALHASLLHRFHGAFMVPTHNHPKARRDYADRKLEQVDCGWQVAVLEAPEEREVPGTILLGLTCSVAPTHIFAGLAYHLELVRSSPEGSQGLTVRLASVSTVPPPQVEAADEGAAEDGSTSALPQGTRLLSADPGRPCFFPARQLGFLFDFPLLREEPGSGEPEEYEVAGMLHRYRTEELDGGLRVCLSCHPPGAPVVRTRIEWRAGEPWYRELVRERVYINDDASEEVQPIASIQLL